jgi:cytochrome c oxidase cbb3-type subunit 3
MRTSRSLRVGVAVGMVMLTAVTAMPEDDLTSISIALGPRAEALIMARCSVCHSADLITQQRIPPARWEATVEKMKHWGAEISEEEAGLLIRYLSARYHPGAPDRLPPRGPMPAWGAVLSEQDIADVHAWLLTR